MDCANVSFAVVGLVAGLFGWLWLRARRQAARVEAAYADAERGRRLLLESIEALPCNLAVFAGDGELVAHNSSYRELHRHVFDTGKWPIYYADLMRAAAERMLPPEEVEADVAARVARHFGRETSEFERLYPNGRWMRATKQRLPSGHTAGFAIDITEMKARERALATSEARYRALVDTASVAIWQVDGAGRTLFANRRLAALFGAVPPDVRRSGLRMTQEAADGPFGFPTGHEVEATIDRPGEAGLHLLVAASPWVGDDAENRSCVLTMIDVTPMKVAQERLEHLAGHDPLTGLENRARFSACIANGVRQPEGCTLLLVDLDRFKEANDTFGHAVGDTILCIAARRMVAALRPEDRAYRLGGDEFAVVLSGTDPATAERTACRLVAALKEPYGLGTETAALSASIGVAFAPTDAAFADDLARAADLALYSVKRAGRAGLAFYNPSGGSVAQHAAGSMPAERVEAA